MEEKLQKEIEYITQKVAEIKEQIHKKIVGQEDLIDGILICLFSKGHVLIEGVPGLAKTITIDTLSKSIDLGFKRIQFTPDLLPSDLVGTEIYNQKTGEFLIKKGPIFSNIVLADEINRSPSKVQSALLESMAERQVTIGNDTFKLDTPFIVLATQNPIEQAGTYRLPEAQLDRFMMQIKVDYQNKKIEKEIYKKINGDFDQVEIETILEKKHILYIQDIVKQIFVSDNIFDYITNIVETTRKPEENGLSSIAKYIQYGISPRGGISLLNASKALAMMKGRNYVIPEDVKQVSKNVLTHRFVLTYEAIVDDITAENIVLQILDKVQVN